ncbi:nuclear transport factor 2 family protein [Paraburkholderia silvatlantica]|uniref:nuclear transport factor 2 family protein n=1 Tax=Paraburkholderia silvatlantica TaxID=321895 RepID=UPI00105E978C|nr:nuclear transport factor 2 family protein [Paraburkholderia silvatlantica]TDQ98543.1 SnoaL-like protein [Paraburkholderia silvatlantica]
MDKSTDTAAARDGLDARLAALEAEHAVRKTMSLYMALCDVPAAILDGESLGALFTDDAVWEGVGPQYAEKFGQLSGRAAIVAMLQRYLPPTPHFATNVHFLTSETIDVAGPRAKGRWIMLQASGYVDERAELIGARLEVDFVPLTNGRDWLIAHFRTARLFDAPWRINSRPAALTDHQESGQ